MPCRSATLILGGWSLIVNQKLKRWDSTSLNLTGTLLSPPARGVTNDLLQTTINGDSIPRYISLLQRFGPKSTIQNFDAGDGNFRLRLSSAIGADRTSLHRYFRYVASKKLLLKSLGVQLLWMVHDVHVPDTFADAHNH